MTRWLPRLHPLTPETGELLHLDLLRFIAPAGIVADEGTMRGGHE